MGFYRFQKEAMGERVEGGDQADVGQGCCLCPCLMALLLLLLLDLVHDVVVVDDLFV